MSIASQLIITITQLGQLLWSARKRRKLTQIAVAHRLGLSQNRVHFWSNIQMKWMSSSCSIGAQ